MNKSGIIQDFTQENDKIGDAQTKGLLLLALAVMGNFVAETLGCGTQKLLHHNRIAKLAIIFFIIYFTVNVSEEWVGENIHPLHELGLSIILWLIFIIFTKTTLLYKGIIFACLCLHYLLNNFHKYYTNNNEVNYLHIIEYADKALFTIIIVSGIIGFVKYILKEKREHKNFTWWKFFVGVDHCDHV